LIYVAAAIENRAAVNSSSLTALSVVVATVTSFAREWTAVLIVSDNRE
jgi:hypothetical protein